MSDSTSKQQQAWNSLQEVLKQTKKELKRLGWDDEVVAILVKERWHILENLKRATKEALFTKLPAALAEALMDARVLPPGGNWAGYVAGPSPPGMQLAQPALPRPLGYGRFADFGMQTNVSASWPRTPLEVAILSPVNRSWQMGCVQRSSNARAYKQAVVVPGTWTSEMRQEIREYVLDKLGRAADQTNPLTPSLPQPDILTSEDNVNTTFEREVGRVTAAALQRCGLNVHFNKNGRNNKVDGLPDFMWMLAGILNFCGGEGKAPSVLGAIDWIMEHVNKPGEVIRKALEQTLSYSRDNDWEWSFLTTLECIWFLEKMPGTEHHYLLYPGIRYNDEYPSPREMMFYVVHKTLSENNDKWQNKLNQKMQRRRADRQQGEDPSTGNGQNGGPSTGNGSQDGARKYTLRSNSGGGACNGGGSTNHTHTTYQLVDGQLALTDVCLGHGASGNIMLGRYNGHDAAVKLAETSQEHALVQQLQHEAAVYNMLQSLQGHCIPYLLGAGYCKDESLFYVATSLVTGHHPNSDFKDALPLAEEALSQIHARGLLHGDISSENILVSLPQAGSSTGTSCLQVWLLDFGQSSTAVTPAACQEEMAQLYRVFRGSGSSTNTDRKGSFSRHLETQQAYKCSVPYNSLFGF